MNEQDEGTFACRFLLKANQDCFFYHHMKTDVHAWRRLVDVGRNSGEFNSRVHFLNSVILEDEITRTMRLII